MPTTRLPLLALATTFVAPTAYAYEIGSPVAVECHERLTRYAVAEARRATNTSVAPALDDDQRALFEDLPFETDSDDGFGSWITVLANRSLDLGSNEATNLDKLAFVHGAEENQKKHCLRRSPQDGAEGARAALEECRNFIRSQVEFAIGGLDADGNVDRTRTIRFPATLSIRGDFDLEAPQFYVGLGRALHTLQDSFSHTYRTPDDLRVTTVLNWAELAEATHDPSVDGPTHAGQLDVCVDLDDFRDGRLRMARSASVELATLLYDRSLSADDKRAATQDILDTYLTYEPGCSASNNWCDAPEAAFGDPEPVTCSDAGRAADGGLALGFALFGFVLMRRRRKWIPWVGLALVFTFAPSRAEASDFGLYVSGSGAVMNSAVSTSIGGRYALSEQWVIGLDGEWNPWLNGTDSVRSGVVNAYGTVIFRVPLEDDNLNLRTTLQLGVSRMMFDLVGVPEGSIGPYVGFNPLGIEWRMADEVFLIIDPAHISVPVPQFRAVPFAFPQYRVTLGLQWGGFDR